MEFIPKYINKVEDKRASEVITHENWNELFNLVINQGDWNFYGHLGIYGFKREALFKMTELPQTPYEKAESLEQLRALQNGMKIKVGIVKNIPVGIDTMEDFEKFKAMVEG